MIILLVNFSLVANHGGILQCYALQEILKGMGHSVVKVDLKLRKFRFNTHQIFAIVKRLLVKTFISNRRTPVFYEYYLDRTRRKTRKNVNRFIDKYLNIIRVDSLSELNKDDYDAVIVGSDQVWRKRFTDKLLTNESASDNAFLAFTRKWNCKRIAYAASIGVDYWEYSEKETEVLKELCQHFDAISVREDSAISLLKQYLSPKVEIKHVLDPTLLLDRQQYIEIFKNAQSPKSDGELLVYILDPNEIKNNIISAIASSHHLKSFCVNNPKFEREEYSCDERIQTSIEQWLRGFYDAKFVVADSFHACVFSIIFEKPFIVIANKERGLTRIESLLRLFNLTNRIVHGLEDLEVINYKIDWNVVNSEKEKLKNYSIEFLLSALNS